jgi:glycosyltransferase involved in cell wall biosynthesis
MSDPLVTIVLPTYRRPDALEHALAGIAAQADAPFPWEIVVVDNAGDGAVARTVATWHVASALDARCVTEARPGASHARNRGIAEARGEVIAFVDDDVVPRPGWLAAITAPIFAGRCDATGGKVVLDESVPRPAWLADDRVGGYLTAFDPADNERDARPDEWLVTANAAFRATLLRDVGGFDTRLGPKGGSPMVNDDLVLFRRCLEQGASVRFVPTAVVVHELPPSRLRPRYLLRRAYAQGRSDWIVDAATFERRPLGGASRSLRWLAQELRQRAREMSGGSSVAMHAACDVVRSLGWLTESSRAVVRRRLARS